MIKFCPLYSGSNGNSVFISDCYSKVLVDAGLSGKSIESALNDIQEKPEEIKGIIITHEHVDHIMGAGILSRRYNIPIYANELTWESMKKTVGNIAEKNIKMFEKNCAFQIGDINIKAFPIPHDASDPVGFNLDLANRRITIATDIGKMTKGVLENLIKSDILLLESNHDEAMLKVAKYPYFLKRRILSDQGHLSNEMAGKVVAYLAENGMKRFVLGHLSEMSNFPELVYQTVKSILFEKGIDIVEDISLTVAKRDTIGMVYNI